MSNIIDLDILFPEEEVVKFTAKNGEVYNITISMPPETALKFIQYVQGDKSEYEIAIDLMHDLMKFENPEITKEWINENIPFKIIIFISKKLRNEIFSSLDIIEGSTGGDGKQKK